jgi:hypothetical protein
MDENSLATRWGRWDRDRTGRRPRRAQLGQLLAVVDLYRVLGGGWKVGEDDWMASEYLPDEPTESED